MGCTEAAAKTSVYRPRDSCSSPLYQCVRTHYEELIESGVVQRTVEEQVLNRFIDCGGLHKGFARIYCDEWRKRVEKGSGSIENPLSVHKDFFN